MNKLIEIILKDIVRRIEFLEEKTSKISIPDKNGIYPQVPMPGKATEPQKAFIISLGGNPENLSKEEAGKLIEKLKSPKVKSEESPKDLYDETGEYY